LSRKNPKKPTHLRLDPALKQAAVELAEQEGSNLTDLVEEGLRLVLHKRRRAKRGLPGDN
jgi:predicted HicB family RNase H-like nuclease